MNNRKAYIMLNQEFVNWKWFRNRNTLIVYLWLLSSANLSTEKVFSETVNRGSVLTNNSTIASECNLTIQNVRTALSNLVKSGDIKREYRNHYQIITITDFESRIYD